MKNMLTLSKEFKMVKRKERKMSVNDEKILIHFNTSDINIYILKKWYR